MSKDPSIIFPVSAESTRSRERSKVPIPRAGGANSRWLVRSCRKYKGEPEGRTPTEATLVAAYLFCIGSTRARPRTHKRSTPWRDARNHGRAGLTRSARRTGADRFLNSCKGAEVFTYMNKGQISYQSSKNS
jgi:hypothetical protein